VEINVFNFELVRRAHDAYADVDMTISPNDAMNNQWYADVGKSAVDVTSQDV
jgi:hypothetical protein